MESRCKKPVRVILWGVPRTLSTVVEKCMNFVPNTQIIHEPYGCAYHMGPERCPVPDQYKRKIEPGQKQYKKERSSIEFDLPMAFESSDCTYDFVKRELETEYPGKDVIFCKDMPYALQGKYDKIPTGYRHTFIIRHPYRVFLSYRKMISKVLAFLGQTDFKFNDLPHSIVPKNYAFQEQFELLTYLQERGEPNPIIIDADDLLQNPAGIMQKYCTLLGIPYSEDMLEWPAGLDVIKSWKASRDILLGNLHSTGGYYGEALKSTKFNSPKEMPRREDLSEDILSCADQSMPFYEKMYSMRLK